MEVLQGKVYRHKADHKYLVLHLVHDSTNETEGNQGVVYVSLDNGSINYRDLAEFVEVVVWPDGVKRPRFVLESEIAI